MNVEALDHVNIITDRLDETAEFYGRLLGLVRQGRAPAADAADRHLDVRCREPGDHPHQLARLPRTYDREVQPGSLTGALHHVALKCTGYEEVKGRLDAMGADYQENLVSAINLRQIFTRRPQQRAAGAELLRPVTLARQGTGHLCLLFQMLKYPPNSIEG